MDRINLPSSCAASIRPVIACRSHVKQRFERTPSDLLTVNQEMEPCAFHKGEEEGLLCFGDRGSLKDGVSMTEEVFVWDEGLNVAIVRERLLGSAVGDEGELFRFSI